jgi:CubicO group peptidase (beta-lactamase class C family)
MGSIDTAIDQALADRRIVGAVVLIARDGRIVYRRAAGLADRERGVAMRLIERGKLSLADPVTRYLPSFRPALPSGEAPTITLRQLMTHTAGLAYGFMQKADGSYHRAGVSDGLDQPGLGMADELDRITRAGLSCRPGERWAYSVAMDVLGAVLEAVEGRDLAGIVSEHVTAPLRLASMGFDLQASQQEKLAACYADDRPEPTLMPDAGLRVHFPEGLPLYAGLAGVALVPARVFDRASFRSAGAGMVGDAGDMLTFVETLRAGGAPIPSAETVGAMMTVQTGTLPIVNRGPGWAFGLGGALLVDPAAAQTPQSRGTFGWGGVWGHAWFVDPVRRLSVVSLSNTALEGMMGRYVRDLRDAIYAEL